MPKIRKVKKRKTYRFDVNRKRLWQKSKKLPSIPCQIIKNSWNQNKSTKTNLTHMGLAYDANHVMKIPSVKEIVKSGGKLSKCLENEQVNNEKKKFRNGKVALELEADATAPRVKKYRLPKGEVRFITQLMKKYGDDYGAMARDKKNYYQLTWRQIKKKIDVFKNIPEQYAEYLLETGEIVLDDPTPLEETKKQIGLENLKKHCSSKKPKKAKPTIVDWIEEEMAREEELARENGGDDDDDEDEEDDDNFNTPNTLKDDDVDVNVKRPLEPEKKLTLFPDAKKVSKKVSKKMLQKQESSDSEDSDEDIEFDDDDDDDDNSVDLKNLSDMSDDDGLDDEDVLDDGSFVTDSDDDSD